MNVRQPLACGAPFLGLALNSPVKSAIVTLTITPEPSQGRQDGDNLDLYGNLPLTALFCGKINPSSGRGRLARSVENLRHGHIHFERRKPRWLEGSAHHRH
jgi:hypothetical protein